MKRLKFAITINSACAAMLYLTVLGMLGEQNPACWPDFVMGISLFILVAHFIFTYATYKS